MSCFAPESRFKPEIRQRNSIKRMIQLRGNLLRFAKLVEISNFLFFVSLLTKVAISFIDH